MSFHLHDPDPLAVDFEQVITSVISFTGLLANRIMICFMSAVCHPVCFTVQCNEYCDLLKWQDFGSTYIVETNFQNNPCDKFCQ